MSTLIKEDQGLVPSIYDRQLTNAFASNSRAAKAFFVLCGQKKKIGVGMKYHHGSLKSDK